MARKKRGPGRPPLPPTERRATKATVRMSPEEARWLAELQRREGTDNPSEVFRLLLKRAATAH